jgi:hypothetical protein
LDAARNFAFEPDEEESADSDQVDQQEGVNKRGQRVRQPSRRAQGID